jgi:hypothetical protein
MDEFNKNNLDQQTLRKLETKIFIIEKENHPIQRYGEGEMVNKIRKVIDEHVRAEVVK